MKEKQIPPMVVLKSISKTFGRVQAVRDLSLNIGGGIVYGLLGPNGSGKSTIMKMIIGLLKPDVGSIRVHGMDPEQDPLKVKQIVGYMPETPHLYEFLTGLEYLDFVADVHGLDAENKKERIHEFLAAFELRGRENDMISGYSHGMKQKTAIIASLLHEPKLLILDEPLSGLDPRSARLMKDLLYKLAGEGVTTVFSTHVLEIADAICHWIAVIQNGEKIAEGTPADLRSLANMSSSTLEEVFLSLTGANDNRKIVQALLE